MERQGIRQFLDIGTGIPATPNTHDIAQGFDPTSRIVYVDNDPIVLAHARALLVGDHRGRTAYIPADLREPGRILANPDVRETLDWSEPIGLLLIAVLHFIRDDDDPAGIIGTLIDALPPGSMVAASHATPEYMPAEMVTALRAVMERQWRDRTGHELRGLFDRPDLELVPPGVQSVSRWWAEDAPGPRPPVESVASNGIVARVTRG
jgi:S-adenosyl methyltransferase